MKTTEAPDIEVAFRPGAAEKPALDRMAAGRAGIGLVTEFLEREGHLINAISGSPRPIADLVPDEKTERFLVHSGLAGSSDREHTPNSPGSRPRNRDGAMRDVRMRLYLAISEMASPVSGKECKARYRRAVRSLPPGTELCWYAAGYRVPSCLLCWSLARRHRSNKRPRSSSTSLTIWHATGCTYLAS